MASVISHPGNNFRVETAVLANRLLNIPSVDFTAFRNNPNQVKIKVDECISLDFSRKIDGDSSDWFIHLGIYGYKFSCLKNFVNWEQSKRELENKLEQFRALDNGVLIKALTALFPWIS